MFQVPGSAAYPERLAQDSAPSSEDSAAAPWEQWEEGEGVSEEGEWGLQEQLLWGQWGQSFAHVSQA